MFTALAVLLRITVNPLSNVFQKIICSKGQSPFFANFLTYAALSLVVIPLAVGVHWTSFPAAFWMYAALVGLFGALGNGFLVKAMLHGELSTLGPINSWKSIVGIIFGMILLREFPTLIGLAGVLLILAGSYVILPANRSSRKFSWRELRNSGIHYRLAAMVFAAVEAVFIKKVILYSDANTAFVLWCWGGMLFSLALILLGRNTRWTYEGKISISNLPLFLGLVASVGLMQWSTNYVFQRMPVGYALALFQLSAVLSVIYGRLIFHETGILKKLLASVVMIAGSILIIFNS